MDIQAFYAMFPGTGLQKITISYAEVQIRPVLLPLFVKLFHAPQRRPSCTC